MNAKTIPARLSWLIGLVGLLFIALQAIQSLPNKTSFLLPLDLTARDLAMRLRGSQAPATPIAIVAVDDASFNYTGYHWPWPRSYLAQIVTALNKAGAKVIGLDVFLFEADPDPAGDKALAQAFADSKAAITVMQISRSDSDETLNLPISPYATAFKGMGISGILYDEDAIVRSLQAYDRSTFDNTIYFNWAFAVAQAYLGTSTPKLASSNEIDFNGQRFLLENQRLLIDFSGPAQTFGPFYSAYQVALDDYPADAFRDKIVLIGATSLTLQDVYPTPFSAQHRTPGVEIIANAVNTLVSGRILSTAPLWANIVLTIIAAGLAWFFGRNRRMRLIIGLTLATAVVYLVAWFGLFLWEHTWFALTPIELTLIVGSVVPVSEHMVRQEMEKRRLRTLFSRFVAPEMVAQLVDTQDISSLNKRTTLTVLFSDIRNFTSLSETLPPDQLVAILNPYLAAMTDIIHQNSGTLDKYEGDGILAFFGEPVPYPDHALRAVRAACEMQVRLEELHRTFEQSGAIKAPFEVGIGLNTGEVFVGLLGSEQRLNYTVIGDSVNLAARLQDLTKEIGGPVLVSEATWKLVKDDVEGEFAGQYTLKGKHEPVKVYRIHSIKHSYRL
jgi:adenylate cyclase